MNIIKKYFAFFVVICVFVSCSTAKFDSANFDKAYSQGDYAQCLTMLKGKNYGKDSVPLKNMDIAVLSHYAKDYESSQKHFKECERLMNQGDLRSIAQFESFYLNILNSLNYYNQGKLEGAVVEIKKADHEKVNQGKIANNALWFIVDDSSDVAAIRGFDEDEKEGEDYKDACSKFGISPAEVSKGTPRKPTENDLYRSSPTAYYLGCLFRKANGDEEGARLDRDRLKVLNPKIDFAKEDDKATLNLISFSGGIAKKEEVVYYHPPEINGVPQYLGEVKTVDPKGMPLTIMGMRYKFAYARARENETVVNSIQAIVTDEQTGKEVQTSFSLLEDFGEDLKKNVALKARREFQKNKAKSILGKTALSITLTVAVVVARAAVAHAENSFAKVMAEAAVSVAELALTAGLHKFDDLIKADTRQAQYLPAYSHVASLALPEGTYNIKVQYMKGSTVVDTEEFEGVNVKKSSLNLVESICLD